MIYGLYDLLYTVPLAFGVLSFAAGYLKLEAMNAVTYALAGVFVVGMAAFRHLEKKFRIAFGAAFAAMILITGRFWMDLKAREFLLKNQGILWMFLVVLGCNLATILMERLCRLHIVGMLGVFAFLAANLIWGEEPSHFGVCMWLLWLGLSFAQLTQHRWNKAGYTDEKKHMVSIAPFFGMGLVVLMLLPVSREPYQWDVIRNIWTRMKESGIALSEQLFHRGKENYETAFLGFSDRGIISGSVRDPAEAMMEVEFSDYRQNVLYLKGKVFDTFDGHTWTQGKSGNLHERMMDTMETYLGAKNHGTGYLSDYILREDVKVRFGKFHTQYVFLPPKAMVKDEIYGLGDLYQQGNDMLFAEKKGYQTEYSVGFYRLNQDHDIFYELAKAAELPTAEQWEDARRQFVLTERTGYSYEDYTAYREEIYHYDTQGIGKEELSEAYWEYLDRLFADTESDYQRLRALERSFSSMNYTLTPGKIPSKVKTGADYLEYFLFEKQAGYCSHFATAFVLIARSMGIPARYVQGFAIRKTPGQPGATVYSGDAHAWAECYLPGLGWMTFDPTPGGTSGSWWQTYVETKEQEAGRPKPPKDPTPEIKPELPESNETETKQDMLPVFYVGILVSAAIGILILSFVIDQRLLKRHYRKSDTVGKWTSAYGKNLRILKQLGYVFENGETITEFVCRLSLSQPELAHAFFAWEEQRLYRGQEVQMSWISIIEEDNRILMNCLKQKSRWQYGVGILKGLHIPGKSPKTADETGKSVRED